MKTPKSPMFWIYLSIIVLFIVSVFLLKRSFGHREVTIDPEFSKYISAYTSGIISVESTIKIQLATDENKSVELNTPIDKKLFSFSPSIKGNAYWLNSRTIEFRPEEHLKQGTVYTAEFYLDKVMQVPDKFSEFEFQFETIKQNFSVSIESFKPYTSSNLKLYQIKGLLTSADVMNEDDLKKILEVEQSGKKLRISWEFHRDNKYHGFIVDSIVRKEKADSVMLIWDGSPIKIDTKGSIPYIIPALGDFKIMETAVIMNPEQHILIRFSDPLDKNQNLEGLIKIEGAGTLTYAIDENEVSVFPSTRQSGSMTLTVEQGIKNVMGYKFPKTQQFQILFENLKPQIRLIGKGVILPSSEGLIFPFQSVNIKTVDVKIIRIFENNVGFFLQNNQLDGDYELKRSGRMVAKKTIQLGSEKQVDFGRWNTFSIDLSKLIEQEPGAIYRIELSFKKKYAVYPCINAEVDEADTETDEDEYDVIERETRYWDSYEYYNDYEGDYGYDYNWEEREDPCKNSYYRGKNVTVSRNILASDLAIIAKGGNDKTMKFIVTDLKTTKPISGVQLEVYDYQRQLLASVKTNDEGMADVTLDHKPFLLIAKNDKQRGYLRLDDGSSLSLSSFDISGQVIQKGIKGYIYGERGVWRPGDSLFLTFVLEDKLNRLPAEHPVIFELNNSLGQLVKKIVKLKGVNGFYTFVTTTATDAPTGNWTVTIKAGGATFSKTIKIETVKPNRLKINIDFGTDIISKSSLSGKLNVKWLHGATAHNLRAQVLVKIDAASTSFPKYSDYIFNDPTRTFSSDEQTLFDQNTDNDGNATITGSINTSGAPGMLKASFNVRVYEEGGDFSVDRFSIPYSPYDCYVGLKIPNGDQVRGMLPTDTTQIVNVVTLDEKGKPISRQNLEVKIYKLDWRWWWDASESELAKYSSGTYQVPIFNTSISTVNGKGSFKFKIKYPEWGRFLIRVVDITGGHASGKTVYFDWPGWAGKARREDPTGASMLVFSTDKKNYKVGEDAQISIPTSGEGRALVSIENGSKVIEAFWVEAKGKETPFSFKVTSEMAPNCYLHITYVQPHVRKFNELPIRMYGVVPLMVDDDATHLSPVINMPDVLRSEAVAEINVSEKNGKPMTYTLALVDEGLLDLTRFKTPDPWTEFYAREALGVKTWDLYDYVLGAYGGKIEQLFAIGGDEDIRQKDGKKANRFKPMVKVLGPFYLSGGIDKHKIQLPQYIGAVRVMVVAGNKGAYGNTEKSVPVRKPLMILATMPRVIGPGESVKLPVTIFAMEKSIRNVKVQVTSNEMFTVDESSKDISFNEPGDNTLYFNLKVKSKLGIGKVKVKASCGSEKAEYDIEIDVRNPNPKLIETIEQVIDGGKSWNGVIPFKGMPATNKAILEVSNIPPVDFGRRLKYLVEYPYGCVEQTTSSAFPQLFLGDVIELETELKIRTDENIKAAINRLNSFMLSDGSLSYWPGNLHSSPWGTSYAGHFLLEAEKKGFTIPFGFKANFIRYQKNVSRNWNNVNETEFYYALSDLDQAYRLYTLALAGDPDMGSMNRLRLSKKLSIQAQWRLAAAYALAGQPEVAKELTDKAVTDVKPYTGFSATYGSEERDWAMILETLTLIKERVKAATIAKKISQRLTNQSWMSTQSTAYSLMAMAKFAASSTVTGNINFTWSFNNSKQITTVTKLSVAQIPLKAEDIQNAQLSFKNNSAGILFVRITTEGYPEVGDKTEFDNGIEMEVNYTDVKGNDIDISKITQGTDFKAIVKIWNKSAFYITDMALNQIFASGWEITTSRLDATDRSLISSATYQDIRDDRVYTFFNLNQNDKPTVYIIKLNASYQGRFYLPSVSCEAMYNSSIGARKAGKWVEVTGE